MEKSILIIGAATLDRLLYIEHFPKEDSKSACKTEVGGGGNGANTASAIGRLLGPISNLDCCTSDISETIPIPIPVRTNVKLLSKIANDIVGESLIEELKDYGVDVSCPLLIRSEGFSSVCTVLVTNNPPYSRTCLFDPGTAGNIVLNDLEGDDNADIDVSEIMSHCIHFHSDSRHTEVALILAREARLKGVPVSIDIERDRLSKDFDELMDLADIIFTNEDEIMKSILLRRIGYDHSRSMELDPDNFECEGKDEENGHHKHATFYANVALLLYYLTMFQLENTNEYEYQKPAKELIVTRGELGAVHCMLVESKTIHEQHTSKTNNLDDQTRHLHSFTMTAKGKHELIISQQIYTCNNGNGKDKTPIGEKKYRILVVGTLQDLTVVDTTGAGDAFIGGFIFSRQFLTPASILDERARILFQLRFGSWVAGRKIGGVGARDTLPTMEETNSMLGTCGDIKSMDEQLRRKIS